MLYIIFIHYKIVLCRGTWLPQSIEHGTLDLLVLSSRLGLEIALERERKGGREGGRNEGKIKIKTTYMLSKINPFKKNPNCIVQMPVE